MADTGAIVALVDADDQHHAALHELFREDPGAWVLPWAILPEVDYLLATHVGGSAQVAFLADIATGAFAVEWGVPEDIERAHRLCVQYSPLRLGLVDGIVMAVAERMGSSAIATLDLPHFGADKIRGGLRLLPRDL